MTQHLRQTVRSFLRCERPATPEAARAVLDEWFGRYRPDPLLLDQEVERYFSDISLYKIKWLPEFLAP